MLTAIEKGLTKGEPDRTVCVMLVGKKYVVGWNDRQKTSPSWRKRMPDGELKYTRHAEAHALQLAAREGRRIRKVYVFRIDKRGKLAMAKPCKDCQMRLWDAGVRLRDIHYTTWDGSMCNMKENN